MVDIERRILTNGGIIIVKTIKGEFKRNGRTAFNNLINYFHEDVMNWRGAHGMTNTVGDS